MEIFTASRIAGRQHVLPDKITIGHNGVTFKIPGFLSGQETTIPYSHISSVDIKCPLAGFSTIIIETTGEGNITATGFFKSDVKRMKELILEKI